MALLEDLRRRVEDGLSDAQRAEVVRLLVARIVVNTEFASRPKRARITIEYRFPRVVSTYNGTGSSPLHPRNPTPNGGRASS